MNILKAHNLAYEGPPAVLPLTPVHRDAVADGLDHRSGPVSASKLGGGVFWGNKKVSASCPTWTGSVRHKRDLGVLSKLFTLCSEL